MLRANLTRIRESAVVLDRFVLEVSPAAAGADGQSQSIQKRHADSSASQDEAEFHSDKGERDGSGSNESTAVQPRQGVGCNQELNRFRNVMRTLLRAMMKPNLTWVTI